MASSQKIIRALWDLEKPIIAAVNGVAAGSARTSHGRATSSSPRTTRASSRSSSARHRPRRRRRVPAAAPHRPHKAKELVFFGDDLSPPTPSASAS
jgi:hypothetical protein